MLQIYALSNLKKKERVVYVRDFFVQEAVDTVLYKIEVSKSLYLKARFCGLLKKN